MATHVPIRDVATMEEQLGLTGEALADRLVRNSARSSAGLGAVAGAVVGAEQLAPPAWLLIPVELVVETLLVAGLEMKLLAELQEVAGTPVSGTVTERGTALARAWAEQRGVRPTDLLSPKSVDLVSRGARQQLLKSLQRRILRRLGRSLGAAVPMMAGAAVGAELNRRATLDFADKVRADLGLR